MPPWRWPGSAAAPLSTAESASQVLTSGGDVYAVTEGTYGELFPEGNVTLADDPYGLFYRVTDAVPVK